MILIYPYNPTPRSIWYSLYHVARYTNRIHQTDRSDILKSHCEWIESKYNIDSDYLMETMGNYALSIT